MIFSLVKPKIIEWADPTDALFDSSSKDSTLVPPQKRSRLSSSSEQPQKYYNLRSRVKRK